MEEVSKRIQSLSESQTIAMAQRSRELKAEGKDIISLSLGEPDFDTPEFIKKAAKKAIEDNFTRYTAVPGYEGLREAISKKLKRDNKLNYHSDQIVVSTGAKQSIANVVLSLVNPGDEVILPSPYWVSYLELVKLAEGVPVFVETSIDSDFKIRPEQLEESMSEKTKMMIFSSPCNPSGSIYEKEELRELAKVISNKKDFYIISDEIYEHINFSGEHESIAQFKDVYDQTITVNGVSKGFAMTGWRLGYIAAPKWIAKACTKMQGQITSATCSITQKAATAALEANPSVTDEMRNAFKSRRDFVLSLLHKIPGIKTNTPKGAFYVFPDVSTYFGKQSPKGAEISDATELSMYLLNEAQVATVTGEAFGNPNCIRLSYAISKEQLKIAIQRIKEALIQLQ